MPIWVQGTMICWGLYDVFMARLYVHNIALPTIIMRVRGHVRIDKLSSHWYARLYMAWGRHVVMCSGGDKRNSNRVRSSMTCGRYEGTWSDFDNGN